MAVKTFFQHYFEQIVWVFVLVFLYFMNPAQEAISFCVFKSIGFKYCWGCGIGHSIHYCLHFKLQQSLTEHLLGIPAVMGILYHLIKPLLLSKKQTYSNGSTTNAYDVARDSA